jgi:O-antigen/teichoic acid export membrane protein
MTRNPVNNQIATPAFRRNFIWNLIGTTCWNFTSLFFLMLATRLNGIDDAGIFSFAFSTACVFYVIGVYSGRTFQITDTTKEISDSDYFHARFWSCAAMLIFALFFCFLRGYDAYKFTIIMLLTLYKSLEAISESTYAVVQKREHLDQVGKSFFLKALFSLIFFSVIDALTHNLVLTCAMLVLASTAVILFYDIPRLREAHFQLEKPNLRKVWFLTKKGFFVFGFSFLGIYLINAPKYAIDSVSTNEIQTVYGIIAMPATVLALFGQYIIQPFLMTLKTSLRQNFPHFIRLTIRLTLAIFAFGIICLLAAWFLGIPVLELLYGVSLGDYLIPLLIIIAGGTFYAMSVVISTSLTTMRDTASQLIAFFIVALFAFSTARLFVSAQGITGACLVYFVSMLALLILYILLFAYQTYLVRIGKHHDD